jgi:type II pantothenate kinase
MILGVDVGGSTTKIVGFNPAGELIGTLRVKADDPVTSMYGAVGHFMRAQRLLASDISRVMLTGVGSAQFEENVFDIPTFKVDEFQAIGYGGLYLSGLKAAYVVSMGTGTAFVRADKDGVSHIGGSGVGGGTLVGLGSILLGKEDISAILELADRGQTQNVDLSIGQIMRNESHALPADLTAANFGRIKSTATEADYAAGILNMIFQTVGMLAAFAARGDSLRDFVLTGTLATLPQAEQILGTITDLHGVRFIIPPKAVYATAVGAALRPHGEQSHA